MSEQKKQRRKFTEEYKREAAGLVIDTGRSIAVVPASHTERWMRTSVPS